MRGGLIFFSTLILSLAAGLGGYSLYQQSRGDSPAAVSRAKTPSVDSLIGTKRADFTLNDLDGKPHSIAEWDGQVVLINFWATWCPPCRREIPLLVDLQREYAERGFTVLGLAMDNLTKVANFVEGHKVSYPNLVGQYDVAKVSALLGNTAGSLPYTVIIDRDGNIRYLHLGEISRETALKQILPLLPAGT